MTSLNSNPLPPLYAAWFDDLLGREIPPETRATCHDCAMCESGGEYQKPGSKLFNPRSKCCTYQPQLHNFLCARLVSPLNWQEVLTLCGPEVRGRAQLTQKAYRAASSRDVPARLQLGAFSVIEASADFFRVYRPDMGLDTFTLSAKIMRLLPFFDGRPTAEVVAQISEKERLRFTDELLRRLVDFRILVAVEG